MKASFTPDPSDHSARIMAAMWKAGQVMKNHVAPMLEREHGVEFKHFVVLERIATYTSEGEAIYPRQLALSMMIAPSHISRMLEELSTLGLITRSLDPVDSRRTRLLITEKGQGVLEATRATMSGIVGRALEGLEQGEAETFTHGLERLLEAMMHVEVPRVTDSRGAECFVETPALETPHIEKSTKENAL